jgi:DNA-binding GntR family transcriptional regulator
LGSAGSACIFAYAIKSSPVGLSKMEAREFGCQWAKRAVVYSMQLEVLLPKDNLSDGLVVALRNMILDGRLPGGERINEVYLAQRLGVSRTPLREALARLALEGALTSVPRIGQFVKHLTMEEFDQIYAIRPLLDPEALRLAGLPPPDRIDWLAALNVAIEREAEPDRIIELDDEWHLGLIADCPNKVLIELIRQFIIRTRRYEMALMRESENVARAASNHRDVIAALQSGDLQAACAALRNNLETGRAPIAAWLRARELKKK